MSLVETITKKRDGATLSQEEIVSFFTGYLKGQVSDYQASAMLMAICIRGMSYGEVSTLTKLMRDSGRVLSWGSDKTKVVDKHSTGGVGDKTSLIILPLCTLEGVVVPMMSGRGLGHTGGTLDKLESIPGMNVHLSIDKARQVVERFGGVFIGQTEELAPLDKRLYALRDVTGTVESIALITASILSKKAAEGIGSLVMDVKFGSGAFMKDFVDAEKLAEMICRVGQECGINTRCFLTNMGSPLGRRAGHILEVLECVEIFLGEGDQDTRDLSLELSADMIHMAYPKRQRSEIMETLRGHLKSGRAWERFKKIVGLQGGDVSYLDDPKKLPQAKHVLPVHANQQKVVERIDVRLLGLAISQLGGGRRLMSDKIDHTVGLASLKHEGEHVEKGEPLAVIHGNDPARMDHVQAMIRSAYVLGSKELRVSRIAKRIP